MVKPTKCFGDGCDNNGSLPQTTISQDDLNRYERLKPGADEFKHLEQKLKAALEAGAPIEPGVLTAAVHVQYQRRRVQRWLFKKCGVSKRMSRRLRKLAPRVPYRSLVVSRQIVEPISASTNE
jgi:hypothetical protein